MVARRLSAHTASRSAAGSRGWSFDRQESRPQCPGREGRVAQTPPVILLYQASEEPAVRDRVFSDRSSDFAPPRALHAGRRLPLSSCGDTSFHSDNFLQILISNSRE